MAANYRDYDGSYRLKRVLRQLAFSERFDAATLEAFIHLAAPPPVEIPGKPAADVAAVQAALEEAGLRAAREPAQRAAPRAGVQTWGGLEFVRVPKGRFLMGSKEDNQLAGDSEKPQHPVEIPYEYWIGRYPVTNEQYNAYVQSMKKEHPVVNVSWDDAMAYCKWLNDTYRAELPERCVFRLPTEAEWEKAARGEYGNEWPWGNEFDAAKCNSEENSPSGTTPVGAYSPQGDSPYGAADMAGNVWEWTHSLFRGYPYDAKDGREKEDDRGNRVLRGGAFYYDHGGVRAASRNQNYPNFRYHGLGFRVGLLPIFHSGL